MTRTSTGGGGGGRGDGHFWKPDFLLSFGLIEGKELVKFLRKWGPKNFNAISLLTNMRSCETRLV